MIEISEEEADDLCRCADCRVQTLSHEYYMVKDAVWRAGAREHELLCIGCLERRLGRMLMARDFTSCPVNQEEDRMRSPRLQHRLANIGLAGIISEYRPCPTPCPTVPAKRKIRFISA